MARGWTTPDGNETVRATSILLDPVQGDADSVSASRPGNAVPSLSDQAYKALEDLTKRGRVVKMKDIQCPT